MAMIVVVEDEPDMLLLVCTLLEDEGYEVQGFPDPVALTDQIVEEEERPRLFLMDIMLPGINGIALAAMLRDRGFGETPKIAMSASPVMLQAAQESQLFQETIAKPFDLGTLLEGVERALIPAP